LRLAIEAAGAQFFLLPPYSPDMNPVEMAFSKLKTLLRQASERTRDGLWAAAWEAHPANLNGDGAADLVLFDRASGTWAQAINDGALNFRYTYGTWGTEWTIQIADFNGDGADDVLLTNPATGVWFTALNDWAGGFVYRSGQWQAGSTVTLADLTADGLSDAIVYNRTSGAWTVAIADGTGGFSMFTGNWGPGWTVQAVNANGDARKDLLLYNPDTGAWVELTTLDDGLTQTGGGTWSPNLTVRALDAQRGSGERDDVLLYSAVTGQATVLTVRGGVASQANTTWPAAQTIATGDIDGDGHTDVVLFDAVSGAWLAIPRH